MTGDRTDRRGMAVAFAAGLALYLASLAHGVHWGDSAEFARRAIHLELGVHARAYPLHRLLTWLAGGLVGSPALGANLVSALAGAATVALVYEAGRRLGGSRIAGAAGAAAAGLAHTFWSYAAVAEVYTLHTAILAGAILLALRAGEPSPRRRLALGAVLSLGLLHHRLLFFALPVIVFFTALELPRGRRLRGLLETGAGFVAGALPFAVLWLFTARLPPDGSAPNLGWWLEDLFLGGEKNVGFLFGEGRKSLGASVAYLAKWLVLNLPGPALLLAGLGLWKARARAGRPVALLLLLLTGSHLVFPLRYDWTGDQYAFLVPLYPVAGIAAAVGVGHLRDVRGRWAARAALVAVASAPLVLYPLLALGPLGRRLVPDLTEDAARSMFLPVAWAGTAPGPWAARNLDRLPPGATLHADWGDGQVYLYLQEAEERRTDVRVTIWYGPPRIAGASGPEWVSVMPLSEELPPLLAPFRDRLRPAGFGLYEVGSP